MFPRGERRDLTLEQVLRGAKKSDQEIRDVIEELEMLDKIDAHFAVQ